MTKRLGRFLARPNHRSHAVRRIICSVPVVVASCVVAVIVAQACINPGYGQGARPGTHFTYSFVGSGWNSTLIDCVTSGITSWNNANANNSMVRFDPVPSGQSPNITFTRVALPSDTGGGTTAPSTDAQGFVTGFGVQFNTNTNVLESCTGYQKVAMHELGHGQGLANTYGSGGSSVMNQMSGKDDIGGNIPTAVTTCDRDMTYMASNDPNVICARTPPCEQTQWIDEFGCCRDNYSPIIVDLDGNGIALTAPEVDFDLAANGHPVRLGWTQAESRDAFLVLDRNGDGLINDGREMFGNFSDQPLSRRPNGFAALALFDQPINGGNVDGEISNVDSVFRRLALWLDSNHDGISQAEELLEIAHTDIAALELTYRESRRQDQYGNQFRFRALVRYSGGRHKYAYDVFLAH